MTTLVRMGGHQGEGSLAGVTGVLLVLAIALADGFTWLYYGVGCGLAENSPRVWIDFCSQAYYWLPAAGAVLMIGGATAAYTSRRSGLYWTSVGVGLCSGLALWVLFGDPAGNFSGLLTGG